MSNDKTLATADASYTTGHCAHNNRPGGCQLHNLQCGWPACDRRPAKPSLATAKHGGCVQLGDGLTIEKRAREMLAAQFDTNGPCAKTAMTAQDTYTMGAVRALINALSAQPTPGGQGGAQFVPPHCQNSGSRICLAAQRDGVICPDDSCDIDDGVRHDHVAARLPVGEPVAWMTHHDEAMLYPTFVEAAAYCDDDEPPIPLYAAHPAQAVDLGQFRPAVITALGHSSPYGLERENLNRLLALIDSKAVGK